MKNPHKFKHVSSYLALPPEATQGQALPLPRRALGPNPGLEKGVGHSGQATVQVLQVFGSQDLDADKLSSLHAWCPQDFVLNMRTLKMRT